MKQLELENSAGYDCIPKNTLKLIAIVISEYLATCFNKCIEEEFFPDAIKPARMIALFNDSVEYNPPDCRLTSLLSTTSKMLKKINNQRKFFFFQKHEILGSLAYAISEITKVMQKACGKNIGWFFLSIYAKHLTMLVMTLCCQNLKMMGLGQICFRLRRYLSNRKQYLVKN